MEPPTFANPGEGELQSGLRRFDAEFLPVSCGQVLQRSLDLQPVDRWNYVYTAAETGVLLWQQLCANISADARAADAAHACGTSTAPGAAA